MMGAAQWIVLLVAGQRLAELVLSRRNARRLIASGGRELGAAHYPFLVAVHASWLLAMLVFVPADAPLNVPLLCVYLLLQAARVWIISSLGRFWTTRVFDLPDAPLVRTGPYRWLRHPNYLVVVLEVAVLPLVFSAWQIAVIFSLANIALLWIRLHVENAALRRREVVIVKDN